MTGNINWWKSVCVQDASRISDRWIRKEWTHEACEDSHLSLRSVISLVSSGPSDWLQILNFHILKPTVWTLCSSLLLHTFRMEGMIPGCSYVQTLTLWSGSTSRKVNLLEWLTLSRLELQVCWIISAAESEFDKTHRYMFPSIGSLCSLLALFLLKLPALIIHSHMAVMHSSVIVFEVIQCVNTVGKQMLHRTYRAAHHAISFCLLPL